MAAAPQTVTTQPRRHLALVEPDSRAGFGALRAELHARCADEDLAELWADMLTNERKAVLASAQMTPGDALRGIDEMSRTERDAIRAAIGRMSRYAQRLGERLKSESPTLELAANARRAIGAGDTQAALHWLGLIERGAQ
ncbi:hypothetical protein [Salinicola avicenniae]|uniref:hypothetical protein n=1 Tax=Salinicola avicenniae TaxID=2916836 RepID=UPI0020745FED|nr:MULTISPECIES: hypothetical protein [unclassified Salinicola]